MVSRKPDELGLQSGKRRAVACINCRNRKIRCDHKFPCGNCSRGRNWVCSYVSTASGSTASQTQQQGSSTPRGSSTTGEVSSEVDRDAVESAPTFPDDVRTSQQREIWHSSTVASLLLPPSASSPSLPAPDGQRLTSNTAIPGMTARSSHESAPDAAASCSREHTGVTPIAMALQTMTSPIRGFMMKARYFSPSTWFYSALLVPDALSWFDRVNEEKKETWQIMQSSKSLSRRLQQKRKIPWVYGEYGTCLPSRETSDVLVDGYLRTFETVQRILHVPTFQREYAMFWENQSQAPVDFLIKLQLCLSLGACLYDDIFSLRPQALQWIREASTWTESFDSPTISISGVQNMCLLSLAQNVVQELIGDRTWIRSGALIRSAMAIGLHRDPTKLPPMPAAQREVRRRLWTTVLELALSSCLDAGGPPMISLRDFDCMLPMNLDDTQLDFDANGGLFASDPKSYTDASLQIALAWTFPARLAIAEYTNELNCEQSYTKTLKLAADLRSSTTRFGELIKTHHSKITDFQRRYYEMVMNRYLFMLHIPYATLALKDSAYLLSRNTCVEAALRLSYAALDSRSMPDAFLDSARAAMAATTPCQDHVRLVLCGSGLFRATQMQALMIIAAELHARLLGWSGSVCLDTTGPLETLRGKELLAFLRVGVEWTKCRILAGQDNIKDYVFQVAILAGINAMVEGRSVHDATDYEGKEASIAAKALLVNLIGDDEPNIIGQDNLAEESWDFHTNDFWTADWAESTGSFLVP